MFITDVLKKEEIRSIAIQDLRTYGIKYRPKKIRQAVQETKSSKKVFKTALNLLPTQIVTLRTGQQLVVPKLVHELCSFILTKVETEGLFRKGGSKSRQNEIKLLLDAGCRLGDEHHEIDVASVLKTFLRELPEPLLPYSYHELFFRCILLEEGRKFCALMLSCLLLPTENLNTLAYFMLFLHQVAEFSAENKMDSYNLAVVIGPSVLPVEEKIAPNAQYRLQKTCELFKLLVENASNIGVIPEQVIERIALSSSCASLSDDDVNGKRKKKRRSGSLTRMFNGLKKMVSSKTGDDIQPPTPDLLATPRISRSSKKRRLETNQFSNKKKRELLSNLTEGVLRTPIAPSRTPISIDPNPKTIITPESSKVEPVKDKKSMWYSRGKSMKVSKQNNEVALDMKSNGAKGMLERRWSAVSQVASFKKHKKRNSSASSLVQIKKKVEAQQKSTLRESSKETDKNSNVEPDYIKISKSEYEEIKSRVSEIERRISVELESAQTDVEEETETATNNIENVQSEYEKTLVQVEPLSPTTDHLAKRFSRELKIRRSAEQKVHRSPSARKIGTLRRRSRERERQSVRVNRTQSWHVVTTQMIPRVGLKRGRPNTIQTGLPNHTPDLIKNSPSKSRVSKRTERAQSFHGSSPVNNSQRSTPNFCTNTLSSLSNWTSAEGFFQKSQPSSTVNSVENGRASLAKLRSQNAGMVLAKAKLFDGLVDSDSSSSQISNDKVSRQKTAHKIGSVRNIENRIAVPRIKTLIQEEKCFARKSNSPNKRRVRSPTLTPKQKCQIARQYLESNRNKLGGKENKFKTEKVNDYSEKMQVSPLKDCNRVEMSEVLYQNVSPRNVTPRQIPNIKKPLSVKSPKRLCRTPKLVDKGHTPLRAVAAVRYNN